MLTLTSSTRRPGPGWGLLVALICACSTLFAQTPKRTPPLLLKVGDNYQVVIPRAALGKEHLLSASIIPQQTSPTSTGLAGKIVRFELFHDGVDLYESTKGLVVTEDLPARRLLTTFPIVGQDDASVTIDFNRGMRRVFTEIWYGSGNRDRVLEVPQSRVFAAEIRDDILALRQSVQARDLDGGASVESRFEVRYFLSTYEEPPNRSREQSPVETRYARFFETAPVIETTTGRSATRIARFDISQPVTFHYSANTPELYVQAVRDGILYWNRAFGTNVIRAEKAPDGVTAPDPRYNIVQWVPWDAAGSAYADVLVDPRTGDSRHGQAYMTSVFAVSGRARARAALRSMRELVEAKQDAKGGETKLLWPELGLPLLESANACQVNPIAFAQQYAQGLEELLASDDLTDAAVLRASQDYVREVVAHEVGHVLGLRHNFAGSLAATMSPKDLDKWFQAYIANKGVEAWTNSLSSSSMMEYSNFKAGVFIGWLMRETDRVLPHDKAAIQWGYFDSKEAQEQKLFFATDQDAARYGDVRTFDYGNRPVLAAYSELSATLRNLPHEIIERFIRARAPRDPRDRIPLEQVNLSVTATASQLAAGFAATLPWFQANARSLAVENKFDFIGELNRRERAEAHWKALGEDFEQLGGLDRVLFAPLPADIKLELKKEPEGVEPAPKLDATLLTARLQKLLLTPAYTNFVGLDEQRYSFTETERTLITERGRRFFKELEEAVLRQVLTRLENAPRDLSREASETSALADDDLVAQLERRIIDLARHVLLAKNDSARIRGKLDKSLVEVPDFRYAQETRMAAAKALNDKTGSFRGWATDAKGDLNKALKEDVDAALNIPNLKEFRDSQLSRPLREWYLRQQDLLLLLPPRPPQAPR
jgi:hypothetical protein